MNNNDENSTITEFINEILEIGQKLHNYKNIVSIILRVSKHVTYENVSVFLKQNQNSLEIILRYILTIKDNDLLDKHYKRQDLLKLEALIEKFISDNN